MEENLKMCYENCFEFLRNGARLKHLLKLHTKMMSINPIIRGSMNIIHDGSLEMAKILFNDNLLKF